MPASPPPTDLNAPLPGRYNLILLIAGLLLLLDIAALVTGLIFAADARRSMVTTAIAARQTVRVQQMTAQIPDLQQNIDSGGDGGQKIRNFQRLFDSFESVQKAFAAYEAGGADVTGPDGDTVRIEAVSSASARFAVSAIFDQMTPLSGNIYALATADEKNLSLPERQKAVKSIAESSSSLLPLVDGFTRMLQDEGARKIHLQTIANAIVVGLSLLAVSFLAFGLLPVLRRQDAEFIAQAETLARNLAAERSVTASYQNFFAQTDEVLFLLDPRLAVAAPCTAAFEKLIGRRPLVGKNFTDLFRKIIPEGVFTQMREHLDRLLDPKVKPHLLRRPGEAFRRVEIHLDDSAGGFTNSHYDFRFQRLMDGDSVPFLIASIRDVTDFSPANDDSRRAQEKKQRAADLLNAVSVIPKQHFLDFAPAARQYLQAIGTLIKTRSADGVAETNDTLRQKLARITEILQPLRAATASLPLPALETSLRDLADTVTTLTTKETLAGNDFLPIVMKLSDNLSLLEELRVLRDSAP